jgi:hypothetical protein
MDAIEMAASCPQISACESTRPTPKVADNIAHFVTSLSLAMEAWTTWRLGCNHNQSDILLSYMLWIPLAGRARRSPLQRLAQGRSAGRASHDGGLLLFLYAAENPMDSRGDVFNSSHLGIVLHLPSKVKAMPSPAWLY